MLPQADERLPVCCEDDAVHRYKRNRRASLSIVIVLRLLDSLPFNFECFIHLEANLLQSKPSPSPTTMPFRQVIINGKTIVISVAEMVVTRSGTAFSRPVHALDQVLLEQTLARAENAIRKPNAFPPELEGKVRRIKLS